jgi:rod shape determining protein RodA
MRNDGLINQIDWLTVLVYFALVLAGWFNIYAADYDPDVDASIFSLAQSSGKQLLWIATSVILIVFILILDFKIYSTIPYILYGIMVFLLILVMFLGREVAGSTSWFEIGSFRFQPSEFTKFATALAMAKFLSDINIDLRKLPDLLKAAALFLVPFLLVTMQGDFGTALVFTSFVLVLFREGMSPIFIFIGVTILATFLLTLVVSQTILIIAIIVIALVLLGLLARNWQRVVLIAGSAVVLIGISISVDFVLTEVLKPHQQKRVMSLINPNADPLGVGWNVLQSKIAIGSGGFAGKGFLEGTQTKFDFVPEQTTDFIFCTIGEEHGWLGSTIMLVLFGLLLLRISIIAERQKSDFVRIYAYGVAAVIFFHFAINISMTIGLFPVIGIPLPFFSYGGSSLWSFTVLLFVLIKLDAHRMELLHRW